MESDSDIHTALDAAQIAIEPGHLYLVTRQELRDLRAALFRGHVPTDFEAKLVRLAKGDLASRYIEKNCRTIIALLQASQEGAFRDANSVEQEQLLRVLAYVRKDDDAIADCLANGFADDQQELRQVALNLSARLEEFKAWRLRHQVPSMWSDSKS